MIRDQKGMKIMNKITIEKNISIKRKGEVQVEYEFESSIIHVGPKVDSGHYYYVNQKNDIVTQFNDECVKPIPFKPNDGS